MKKTWLLTSVFCSMLLLAAFASAEVSGDYQFPETRYIPYQTEKQQRLLMDDYQQYFYFDRLDRPQTQRVLDIEGLDIKRGDLATPAIAGAQRILDEKFAWRFGYDLETGEPLLSPYGERKVLKARGYGGTPIALESGAPIQVNMRHGFRTNRARRMAQWLAIQHKRLPVIRRYSQYPLISVQSLNGLDRRPIYLDEYEYYSGLRDVPSMHSNIFLRQHFLRDLPGISFNELRELAGSGQLKTDVLGRLEFLAREGVEDDYTFSDLSTRYGEYRQDERGKALNSNILNRAVFLRAQPGEMTEYDRYPETRHPSGRGVIQNIEAATS